MATYNLDIRSKEQYFISNPGDDLPWVQRVAREQWGPDMLVERFFNERAFIAFIQQGYGYISYPEGPTETLEPGTAVILSGHAGEHQLTVKPGADLHLLIFILANSKGVELADSYVHKTATLPLADPGRVEALFYRLFEIGAKGGIYCNRIAGLLVEPILLTIDQEFRSHSTADNKVFALFSQCRSYIENNWATIASVNDVPQMFGISQPYMGKLFRKYEGQTPHQFLLSQKMNYAIYELQSGANTIAYIADALGFSDAYSFSKTFKRVIGRSPSRFRRASAR